MAKFILIILLLIGSPLLVFGQVSGDADKQMFEAASRFRRVSEMLRYVNGQVGVPDSAMELVDFQRDKLLVLRAKYEAAVKEFAEMDEKKMDASISLPPLFLQVDNLERELAEQILVNGQFDVARTAVFEQLLERSGRDFVAVIMETYLDELNLTDKQFAEAFRLRRETDRRLHEAKKMYEKEVKEILAESKDNFGSMLSDSQKVILQIGK